MAQSEVGLQVGGSVASLLLEKVRENQSDMRYQIGGYDANQGTCYDIITYAKDLETSLKETYSLTADKGA